MRINITTSSYFPSVDGTSIVVQINVKALIELGHDICVYTSEGSLSKYGETVYTFNIKGNGRLFNNFNGQIKEYTQLLKENSILGSLNIYHGWHSWSTHLALNLNLKDVKQIVYSHGIGFNTLEPFFIKLFRKLLYYGQKKKLVHYMNILDAMIFISNDIKHPRNYDYFNFNKQKFLIDNPILNRDTNFKDTDETKINYIENILRDSNKLFLNISNYQSIKNQLFLINLINSFEYESNIIFIGSKGNKYLDYLKTYTNRLSNKHRIHFFTNVSDYIIEYALSKSYCFLFASKNDFVPLVLIESNKFSLPFISFKTADVKRKGGVFVKSKDEYINMFKIFYNKNLNQLKSIGTEGYDYYINHNTYDIYKKNINKIINTFDDK
jgi:hypothetical protein